jgi:hypothetical protein
VSNLNVFCCWKACWSNSVHKASQTLASCTLKDLPPFGIDHHHFRLLEKVAINQFADDLCTYSRRPERKAFLSYLSKCRIALQAHNSLLHPERHSSATWPDSGSSVMCSNSIKFTPPGGSIYVSARRGPKTDHPYPTPPPPTDSEEVPWWHRGRPWASK